MALDWLSAVPSPSVPRTMKQYLRPGSTGTVFVRLCSSPQDFPARLTFCPDDDAEVQPVVGRGPGEHDLAAEIGGLGQLQHRRRGRDGGAVADDGDGMAATGVGSRVERGQSTTASTAATFTARAAFQCHTRRPDGGPGSDAAAVHGADRFAGSGASRRPMAVASPMGTSGRLIAGTGSPSTRRIRSLVSSPILLGCGDSPVSAKCRTAPRPYMSVRSSTTPVRSVSGATHSMPCKGSRRNACRCVTPKSASTGSPVARNNTFVGLTPPWHTPARCAAASARDRISLSAATSWRGQRSVRAHPARERVADTAPSAARACP